MSMNKKPFGNIDFSEFMMPDHDASNNIFMQNRQNSNVYLPGNNMEHTARPGYAAVPNGTKMQERPAPTGNIMPVIDIDTLNKGFEEMERGTYPGTPAVNLPVATNMPLQTNVALPNGGPNGAFPANQPSITGRRSFNPYADYLARTQQAEVVSSNNGMEANMLGPVMCSPNYALNGNQANLPSPMVNMTGMIPSTFPGFNVGMNRPAAKKKGVKATAYDLMTDLITRIPMFAYKQEIYIYNAENGCYENKNQNEVEQLIMDMYRPIIREQGSGALIEKTYKLLLKEPQIVRNEVPLSDPTKISFANCTVDIQKQTMSPHSPGNVVTHAMTCNLARFNHTSEECPVFDGFLHDISGGDPALEMRIWEIMGYCLTPDGNAKVFFVLQGKKDAGKTLFCNFLSDFFPEDKVSALNVHSLREKFAKGNLQHFVLCVSPDLPPAPLDSTSTSVIKQITGNDKISAPVKYKNNVQFRFEGKLILATNYPLLTEVPDDAFMQRAVVVPFLHTIPREHRDVDLLDKMKAEKPAIASKALDAYFRLRNNHYQFSGNYEINSSVQYQDAILDDSEITPLVYNFLRHYFEKDPAGEVAIEAAFELFTRNISNQFTEKMFSIVFQRFAEELYGASRIRSYHGGKYQNARSTIRGIRFQQM